MVPRSPSGDLGPPEGGESVESCSANIVMAASCDFLFSFFIRIRDLVLTRRIERFPGYTSVRGVSLSLVVGCSSSSFVKNRLEPHILVTPT